MHITLTCNGEYVNAHCWSLWHCNDRLSEKGILTSLRLAKELKNQIFDYIFCSDFGFRRTTTDIIVEQLIYKESKIIVDANLREKDADICTQKIKENMKIAGDPNPENTQIISRLFIRSDSIPSEKKNSETIEEVLVRSQKFLHQLLHTYPSSANILIVGSPIINSFIIAQLKWESTFTKYITSPCSLSEYDQMGQKRKEIRFNNIQHLHLK